MFPFPEIWTSSSFPPWHQKQYIKLGSPLPFSLSNICEIPTGPGGLLEEGKVQRSSTRGHEEVPLKLNSKIPFTCAWHILYFCSSPTAIFPSNWSSWYTPCSSAMLLSSCSHGLIFSYRRATCHKIKCRPFWPYWSVETVFPCAVNFLSECFTKKIFAVGYRKVVQLESSSS